MIKLARTILVLINIFALLVYTFAQQITVTKTVTIPLATITVTESVPLITLTVSNDIPIEKSISYSTFFEQSTIISREKSIFITPNATYSIKISGSGTSKLLSSQNTATEVIGSGRTLISTICTDGKCSSLPASTTNLSDSTLTKNTAACKGTECSILSTISSFTYTLRNIASNSTLHSMQPTHLVSNGSSFNSSIIYSSAHGMTTMSNGENKATIFNSKNVLGSVFAVVLAFLL